MFLYNVPECKNIKHNESIKAVNKNYLNSKEVATSDVSLVSTYYLLLYMVE